MSASPAGVLPGRYTVVWRMALKDARLPSGNDFWLALSAKVVPRASAPAPDTSAAPACERSTAGTASPSAAAAAAGGAPGLRGAEPDAASAAALEVRYTAQGLGHLLTVAGPQPLDWADVAGPLVEVHGLSEVEVGCFAHDNWWKSSIKWDYVQLVAEAGDAGRAGANARSRRSSGRGSSEGRSGGSGQEAGGMLFSHRDSCVCS